MAIENGEPSGFHPPESSEKEKPTSEKKKSLWSFLKRHEAEIDTHVESVEPDPYHNIEEDDDDEEDEKSFGSKWFKTWRKKFKDLVDVAPVTETEEEPQEDNPSEEPPLLHEAEEPLPVFDESMLPSYEEPQEAQTDLFNEQPVEVENERLDEIPEEAEIVDSRVEEAEAPPVEPETIAAAPVTPEVEDLPPETEDEPEDEVDDLPDSSPSGYSEVVALPGIGTETTPEPQPAQTTIINKGSAAAALGVGLGLVANYRVSKERDQREKQDTEQQKGLEEVQQIQMRQQQELERKLAELRNALPPVPEKVPEQPKNTPESKSPAPKIERAPEERSTVEKEAKKPEKIPSVGQIIAESKPQFIEAKEKQRTPEVTTEIPYSTKLNPEEILRPDFAEKSSELVLQQVEAAAEQDVAQEKQYELRHEVKDVASSLAAGTSGAFIASRSDGQNTTAGTSSLGSSQSSSYDTAAQEAKNATLDQSSGIYKQAVWAGLWGAIVILVAVGVWVLSA